MGALSQLTLFGIASTSLAHRSTTLSLPEVLASRIVGVFRIHYV